MSLQTADYTSTYRLLWAQLSEGLMGFLGLQCWSCLENDLMCMWNISPTLFPLASAACHQEVNRETDRSSQATPAVANAAADPPTHCAKFKKMLWSTGNWRNKTRVLLQYLPKNDKHENQFFLVVAEKKIQNKYSQTPTLMQIMGILWEECIHFVLMALWCHSNWSQTWIF